MAKKEKETAKSTTIRMRRCDKVRTITNVGWTVATDWCPDARSINGESRETPGACSPLWRRDAGDPRVLILIGAATDLAAGVR